LKVGHHYPPVHQQHKLFEAWAEELEKRTGGRVKVELYPAEALCKVREECDALLNRTFDVGDLIPTYYPGRFPLEEIFHLPWAIPAGADNPIGKEVRHAVFEKFLIPYHFSNMKVLWTGRFDRNVLHMADKEVRIPDDVKGLVIGFPGGKLLPKLISAVGASPEQVTVIDMYTALERGTIDGQIIPLEAPSA